MELKSYNDEVINAHLTTLISAFCLVLLAQCFFAPAAQAYLDPGTGAFIVQTLFGLGLACAVTLARFKKRVVDFFQKPKAATQTPEQVQSESGDK